MIPLIPLAIASFGVGLSKVATDQQNEENAEQAQLNRDFQERMRNTQWQAAVADMKAAGLNPALAYQQGGNAAPSGSSAAAMQNVLSQASTATSLIPQTLLQKATIDNINADTDKKMAESQSLKTENYYLAPYLDNRNQQAILNLQTLTDVQRATIKKAFADLKAAVANANTAEVNAKRAEIDRLLAAYGINEAKASSEFYGGLGKWSPYVGGIKSLLNILPFGRNH